MGCLSFVPVFSCIYVFTHPSEILVLWGVVRLYMALVIRCRLLDCWLRSAFFGVWAVFFWDVWTISIFFRLFINASGFSHLCFDN